MFDTQQLVESIAPNDLIDAALALIEKRLALDLTGMSSRP